MTADDTNAPDPQDTQAPPLPAWFTKALFEPFEAGVANVFLVHGDVHGLQPNPDCDVEPDRPYLPMRAFFEKVFDGGRMVMFYDVASGLRFLRPSMEQEFLRLSGAGKATAPGADPIAAAKADLAARRGLPRDPEACLPLIENVLRSVDRAALIVESAHAVAPSVSAGFPLPPSERATLQRLRNWARDDTMAKRRNMVLLLTEQAAKLSSELRSADTGIPLVFIPKPNEAERVMFLRRLQGTGAFSPASDFGASEFGLFAQGMSLRQIQEILLRAQEAGVPIQPDFVKDKKREILNAEYGEVMEVVDPVRGLDDIGGHEHIKRYFGAVLRAIREGEPRLVPMGVTLMGPPGTGKTAIVEALAKEAGFNFVKLRNVRSMWVGESEARMDKLVSGLRALAPVVVMNDEADLAEGGRDAPRGDSGVSERLMKSWMELLSDPRIRGRIVVIHCTNRPDRIDPALKRSGRSDERILMPMPSITERIAILKVQLRRHRIDAAIEDFSAHGRTTEGMSGADLEKTCLGAYRFAREAGKSVVEDDDLQNAIRDFLPGASQGDVDGMTAAGLAECSSRRLLPPNVEELVLGIEARGLVPNLSEILAGLVSRGILTRVPAKNWVPSDGAAN